MNRDLNFTWLSEIPLYVRPPHNQREDLGRVPSNFTCDHRFSLGFFHTGPSKDRWLLQWIERSDVNITPNDFSLNVPCLVSD